MSDAFEFLGQSFKLHKIDAIKQFHIVRRVAPILTELLTSLKASKVKNPKDVEKLSEKQQLDLIGKFAGPIMTGLSKLSDEDAEFVLYGLLSSVEVKQVQGNWAFVAREGLLMMQNLELPQLLQIAGRAFLFNLSNFLGALPQE